MTDVLINPVNFTAPTSGSFPQQQVVTDANGPGVAPTAVILIVSGNTTTGSLDTPQATGRISIGFSDFTSSISVGGVAEDNDAAATADTAYRVDNNALATLPTDSGGGGLDSEVTIVSRAANEVTIEWSALAAQRCQMIFVYGSGISASVEALASSASIGGTVTSTALGKPTDLLIACTVGQTFDAGSSGPEYMLSFGLMARHSNSQGCVSAVAEDQQSPTSVGSFVRNDAILSKLVSAAGVVTEETRLEAALTSTGFTITTRNAAVSLEAMYLALHLNGANCWVGVETIAAGTTGNKDVTSVGFLPRTVGAFAIRGTAVNTLLDSQNPLSFGWATANVSGLSGLWARDNQATSESDSVASQSNLIDVLAAGATHDWQAAFVSFLSNGFRINVTDAAGGDRMCLFFALRFHPDHTYLYVKRRWLRQLARM